MQIPSSSSIGCAGTIYTILSVLTAFSTLPFFHRIYSTPLQLTNCADAEGDKEGEGGRHVQNSENKVEIW